jgi:hypothetical protein
MTQVHALARAILLAFACALAAAGCGRLSADPDPGPADSPAAPRAAVDPSPSSSSASVDDTPPRCDGQACAPPQQCIRYSGVAGPSVPLYACGIPCSPEGACPEGKTCAVIADGPRMCR